MSTIDELKPTKDEAMGMSWWNSLSEDSRAAWAAKAGTGVVADAWAAFKGNVDLEARQVGMSMGDLNGFMARSMSVARKRGR